VIYSTSTSTFSDVGFFTDIVVVSFDELPPIYDYLD